MKKKRNCKGSMTVEAVLVLPIFIFAFMAFLIVTKYIYLQVVLQNAINQSAKEIARYSYIVTKVSALDFLTQGTSEQSQQYMDSTNEYVGNIMEFFDVLQTESENVEENLSGIQIPGEMEVLKNPANLDVPGTLDMLEETYNKMEESVSNVGGAASELADATTSYFEDPAGLLAGLVSVVKDGARDVVRSRFIAAPISKALCKKYLPCEKGQEDLFLKKYGVENGVDGLNFNLSTLFEDGKSVNIVVVYTVAQEVPFFGKLEIDCKLTASTAGWLNLRQEESD